MSWLWLVTANLLRRRARSVLLLAAIAINFLIFGVLVGFGDSLQRGLPPSGINRLVVSNAISFTQPLPATHVDRVRQVDGVLAAGPQTWFGAYYREPRNFLSSFAVDPSALFAVSGDALILPAEARAAFQNSRTAMIVGEQLAARHAWRVGQRVTLTSDLQPRADGGRRWDFTIVGIYPAGSESLPADGAYVRHDYIRDGLGGDGAYVGSIIARTRDAASNDAIARSIEASFADSAFEVKAEDERSFSRAFIDQFGDVARVIRLVVGAGFLSILVIVGSTMMTAIRERTREIGVMKTLGFGNGMILRLVLGESLLLSLLGAALGLALAAAMLAAVTAMTEGQLGLLSVAPATLLAGLACAIGLGVATGITPALVALRLKPIDAINHR